MTCPHNAMVERAGDPQHAWQCADCGYVYRRDELCDGTSDDCTGVATVVLDTSDGYCPPAHFCAGCAADWQRRAEDGP